MIDVIGFAIMFAATVLIGLVSIWYLAGVESRVLIYATIVVGGVVVLPGAVLLASDPPPIVAWGWGTVSTVGAINIGIKYSDQLLSVADRLLELWGTAKSRAIWTVETRRGSDRIERGAAAIPDRLWSEYSETAVVAMYALFVGWALVAVAAVLAVVRFVVADLEAVLDEPGEAEPVAAADLLVGAEILIEAVVVSTGAYLLLVGALAPGLVLHELSHAVAAAREGVNLRASGIIFAGPLPMGAFVRLEHDWMRTAGREGAIRVLAAGVFANLVWGSILVAAGVALVGGLPMTMPADIPGTLAAAARADTLVAIGTALYLLGIVEWGIAFLNAIPVWRVDGGLVRQVRRAPDVAFAPPRTDIHRAVEGIG